MTAIEIGRMLRAGTTGFVVGCRVSQLDSPSFGALVRVPQANGYEIYGMIYDIRIDDDGLVRQLVTAGDVDDSIIADNRVNRNVPIEMSVLSVGYGLAGRVYHLLPPRPPLSLDVIFLCEPAELRRFTSVGNFGYFRHVLRSQDVPVGEVLATHLKQAHDAHAALDDQDWIVNAAQELITLLRDDYPTLMAVLGALADALPGAWTKEN
jgi:hypothetical protein